MSYLTRAMGKPRFERIFRKMGKLPPKGAVVAKEEKKPAPDPAVSTVADVLSNADEMDFFSWKALAADILGDDIPSKKKDIIEALQAKADAEKGA